MLHKLRLKLAFNRLEREIKTFDEETTTETLVEFLYTDAGSLIRPWQYREELQRLVALIEALEPRRALEIGTAHGGTLFLLCQLSHPKARIMSIDLPEGKFGGGYPESKTALYQSFARSDQRLELLRADSHLKDTFQRCKAFFKGQSIDYLFIDGDHTYEGVKRDFELYAPLVRSGGVIAFHDIVVHPGSSCQVDKLWNEVKQGKRYEEYVNNWEQGQYGIGVLYKE